MHTLFCMPSSIEKSTVRERLLTLSIAMAVVLHCSCILLRRDAAGFVPLIPPSDLVPVGRHFFGKLASVSSKVKKFQSHVGEASGGQFETSQELLDRQSILVGLNGDKTPDSGATLYSLHADERMLGRSPAVALIITNALMLSMPFQALAEVCEGDRSVFSMPLLLFVAVIGATVGGLVARQRKGELQRLNEQLRQINSALRRQAKIESYAPALSYAPVNRIPENEVIVDPKEHELVSHLKSGKKFLRSQELEKAHAEFKLALELAQSLRDPVKEKKAARGLGASLQRQGKYQDAIKYHSMVLEISKQQGETSGNAEAYGAIADCYTELGDLEKAGKYYDSYISLLQSD